MVIYEVLSGEIPFAQYPIALTIMRRVLEGERPERPKGERGKLFTDKIWQVVKKSWKPQPHRRIGAEAILLGLGGSPSSLRPTSNMDGDVSGYTDGRSDDTASDSSMFLRFIPGSPSFIFVA